MKNDQWENWTEPLEVLLDVVKQFIETVKCISSLTDFAKGGECIESPKIYTRKEDLSRALATCTMIRLGLAIPPKDIWTTGFLANYIYITSVYEDAYDFVFDYIGENEHQMDLHGDEFAQTKADLLEDFCLYLGSWTSPYWRSLE